MEFKTKKTYEIIEIYPSVLKTTIPIIDLFLSVIYFLGIPFYFFFRTLKTKESFFELFKKKEEIAFDGPELKFSVLKNLKGEKINFIPDNIVKTEIIFHEKKNSFSVLNNLLNKGYSIDINSFSSNFIIKEKTEFFNLNTEKDLSEEVYISSPEFAEKIAFFFKINQ